MEPDNIKLCTQIVESFSTSTQVLIGAILTIALNIVALIAVYLKQRKADSF